MLLFTLLDLFVLSFSCQKEWAVSSLLVRDYKWNQSLYGQVVMNTSCLLSIILLVSGHSTNLLEKSCLTSGLDTRVSLFYSLVVSWVHSFTFTSG